MFLKKLILKNFKSFEGKRELEFPTLITAVVGPNGCGKSNILDAIRWVLGEQSFKNLRIEEGKDLIFSTKNKSASFAEVEIIFDNSKNIFPLNFSEISILRRIDRSGENFYYLNHQPARLKDIIEISASAKIGLKGFSFINQGAVENVLKVSPEERREMLEENLGLKPLEIKKEEAQRKLINTQKNLEEAEIIVKEITPHFNFLKRQISRFQKREKIEAELKELLKQYFALLYNQIEAEKYHSGFNKEEALERINLLKEKIKEKEKEIEAINNRDRTLEEEVQKLTQEIFKLQDKKGFLLEKISLERAREVNSQTLFFKKEDFIEIKNELEKIINFNILEEIKRGLLKIIQKITEKIGEKPQENKTSAYREELQKIEKELEEKTEKLRAFQEQLKSKNLNFKTFFQEIESLREEKETLEKEIQKEEILNERYRIHFEEFLKKLTENNLSLEEIKNYSLYKDFSLDFLERRIYQLKNEINEIGKIDENLLKEYEETNERYNFYLKQIEDLKRAIEDLNKLIKDLEEEIKGQFQKALKEINKEFNRYFHLMFKGGSASLIEVKDNARNYWGVDIKVDILKTQIKSISMLSGGEKTLIAIALLFAIVNYSNPPLLILDEIDAALDEENSRRFSEILKELSQETQFIVITHNRMTMESAGTIYGVTLSKNNSSLLLSVKLEEAQKNIPS